MLFLPFGQAMERKLQLGERGLPFGGEQGRRLLQLRFECALQYQPLLDALLNGHVLQQVRFFCLEGVPALPQCAQFPHGLLLTIPAVLADRR